ncbi:MAG: sigma-70 family RNA polymerase sigma factor [Rhodobacter sp.]|nr:sigma-70 family RNA polymerase sigma factor [Rhodobacter sp.]
MEARPDPQAALLDRIAGGDKAALKQLYELCAGRLMGIALRMLGSMPMAEEAVQDTFVSIWSGAGRFDASVGSAQAWITTILRRRALDRLRASPWLLRETELGEMPRPGGDRTLGIAVRQCLDQLAVDHRISLLYVYYFGMTHSELSQKLQKPLGTVKSWVRRGLLDLKVCLDR